MQKSTTRVPGELPYLDLYMKAVVNLLLSAYSISIPPILVWQILGLSATEIADIQAFLAEWWTDDPTKPGAYELHTNQYGVTKSAKVPGH